MGIYITAFIDRGSLGNARLMGITKDVLSNNDKHFSFALSCFFITYIVFSIPGTLFSKIVPPSTSLGLGCFLWSAGAAGIAATHNPAGVFVCRMFIGLGESLPRLLWRLQAAKRSRVVRSCSPTRVGPANPPCRRSDVRPRRSPPLLVLVHQGRAAETLRRAHRRCWLGRRLRRPDCVRRKLDQAQQDHAMAHPVHECVIVAPPPPLLTVHSRGLPRHRPLHHALLHAPYLSRRQPIPTPRAATSPSGSARSPSRAWQRTASTRGTTASTCAV